MKSNKQRIIRAFEKMTPDQQEQIKLAYPEGFSQYLIEFKNSKDELVSALPFETEDIMYLIKMSAKKAREIIFEDDDYDDDGLLKGDVKEEYEDKHAEADFIDEEIPDFDD